MKNSEILVQSLSQWSEPIIETAMQSMAGGNSTFSFVKNLISPEWISRSVMEHLGLPYLKQMIGKLPEDAIPQFSLDLIDGMIDKRVKEGSLDIPTIGIRLNPDAFRNLKGILEKNLNQYSELKEEPLQKNNQNGGVKE